MVDDLAAHTRQLLAERMRRDRFRTQVSAALWNLYEKTSDARDRVRACEVIRAVRAELQLPGENRDLRAAIVSLMHAKGVTRVRPNRVGAIWCCVKERSRELRMPPAKLSRTEVSRLTRAWHARMRAEALPEELHRLPTWRQYRANINSAYFDMATQHYHRMVKELQCWHMYVFDGLSIRDIAVRVGWGRDLVHRVVLRWRAAMEGRTSEVGQETRIDATEDTTDDDDGDDASEPHEGAESVDD